MPPWLPACCFRLAFARVQHRIYRRQTAIDTALLCACLNHDMPIRRQHDCFSGSQPIVIHIRFDDGWQVNAAAVIALSKGNTPYRVLAWHDDLDGPFAGEEAGLALR